MSSAKLPLDETSDDGTAFSSDVDALEALFSRGQHAEAAALARAMTVRAPGCGLGWKGLGVALLHLGRNAEALEPMQKAAELLPDDAEIHNNLSATFYLLGQPDKAEHACRRAIKITPDYPEAHYNLGMALFDLRRRDEAEAACRRALELKPDYALAHCLMGTLLEDQNRFTDAKSAYRRALEIKSDQVVGATTHRTTALLCFGRSGTLFFHSLLDGHPRVTTLPGIYFAGWFRMDEWKRLAPDTSEREWRERLVQRILNEYQPLFNARCRNNVPGSPVGDTAWLAREVGFADMGADRLQVFSLDQNAFADTFRSLLAPLSAIRLRECFEIIHKAFDIAIRGNKGAGGAPPGNLFYHIHKPNRFTLSHFLEHYPEAGLLHLMRNPVQSMESGMVFFRQPKRISMEELANLAASTENSTDALKKWETDARISQWDKMARFAVAMFADVRSPLSSTSSSRGVRLEDVKRNSRRVMPQIAAWMGIEDHPALYHSDFCGLQYWGPSTAGEATKITGFDPRSIDQPLGRLLGSRDLTIFETLFWPLSHRYGYTEIDAAGFKNRMADIRAWLDEPLEFEARLYAELPWRSCRLDELLPYRRLHSCLLQAWDVLSHHGTYQGIVQPLDLE